MDGHIIPLDIINGLPYTPMRPFTDKEWDTLPHVQLTSDGEWDPRVLDHSISNDDEWLKKKLRYLFYVSPRAGYYVWFKHTSSGFIGALLWTSKGVDGNLILEGKGAARRPMDMMLLPTKQQLPTVWSPYCYYCC